MCSWRVGAQEEEDVEQVIEKKNKEEIKENKLKNNIMLHIFAEGLHKLRQTQTAFQFHVFTENVLVGKIFLPMYPSAVTVLFPVDSINCLESPLLHRPRL